MLECLCMQKQGLSKRFHNKLAYILELNVLLIKNVLWA